VRGLLERQWESVHPQLDAEDENDPTARVNAILPLADVRGALGYLRSTPFVQSAMLGRFTLRDLKAANGTLRTAEEETKPASLGDIEACCLDCPLEQLEQSKVQSAQALEHARAIDALLMDRLGVDSPELKPLIDDLQELDKFLQPQWAARSGVMVDADAGSDGEGVAAAANGGVAATGKIGGRADVVRRIDELCNYYSANEPSSPVPILLRRARGLVGKGFEEILQDLAPGGVTEMQVFVGSGSGEE
jgi:type VI secretion system protein ImpA